MIPNITFFLGGGAVFSSSNEVLCYLSVALSAASSSTVFSSKTAAGLHWRIAHMRAIKEWRSALGGGEDGNKYEAMS